MRPVLAVALLDLRRLWMPVGAVAVAVGLFPSLTRGLGMQATAQESFPFAFGAAALIAGAAFGMDFAENKPSFFFARPLSTTALFAGRIVALVGLVLLSIAAFLSAQVLSGLISSMDPLARFHREHLAVIAAAWPVALFFSLAAAAHTRQLAKAGLRAMILGLLRLVGVLALTALMVGLFTDLVMRAYDNRLPILVLMSSYVVGALIASCTAIELGRTNRLRITKVLNIGVYIHSALAAIAVLIAWSYVLRPGPDAITSVVYADSSPDGGSAFVAARVDRGTESYLPRFRVDLSTGEVRRLDRGALNATKDMPGQWHSGDGSIQVWTDQVPMLLRNVWQLLVSRSSPFHFQLPFGAEQSLALPNDLGLSFDWEVAGLSMDILPASGGDVFAVQWRNRAGSYLAFMSPTRGQLSVVDLAVTRRAKRAWIFLPSGQLRLAFQQRVEKVEELQVVDIDPATGTTKPAATAPIGPAGELFGVRFDKSASRALVETGPPSAKRLWLVTLDGTPQAAVRALVAVKQFTPASSFLADGREVVMVREPRTAELRFFSKSGEPEMTIPLGEGASTVGSEPFPNILLVSTRLASKSTVRLFDTLTGQVVREIDGFHAPVVAPPWLEAAPAGSAGARILMAKEVLYLLPSMTEAPRQLLPRP